MPLDPHGGTLEVPGFVHGVHKPLPATTLRHYKSVRVARPEDRDGCLSKEDRGESTRGPIT